MTGGTNATIEDATAQNPEKVTNQKIAVVAVRGLTAAVQDLFSRDREGPTPSAGQRPEVSSSLEISRALTPPQAFTLPGLKEA